MIMRHSNKLEFSPLRSLLMTNSCIDRESAKHSQAPIFTSLQTENLASSFLCDAAKAFAMTSSPVRG